MGLDKDTMDERLRPKGDNREQTPARDESISIAPQATLASVSVDNSQPFTMRWQVTESLQAHSEVLLSRLKFLVVDDIRATCDAIFELLKAFGVTSRNVTRCTSLARAKQRIQREPADVIIGDLYLADGSGFDLLKLIRSTPETHDAIFVLITSAPSEDILIEARALNVSSVLAKPISFYDLQEHLLYCLLTQGVALPPLHTNTQTDALQAPPDQLLTRFSAISKGLTTRANSGFRKKGLK